jgi:hypothetical protein
MIYFAPRRDAASSAKRLPIKSSECASGRGAFLPMPVIVYMMLASEDAERGRNRAGEPLRWPYAGGRFRKVVELNGIEPSTS